MNWAQAMVSFAILPGPPLSPKQEQSFIPLWHDYHVPPLSYGGNNPLEALSFSIKGERSEWQVALVFVDVLQGFETFVHKKK
jgi:hypothetical protein